MIKRSQTLLGLSIAFFLLLIALPTASAVNITDYDAYYPFDYTSAYGEFNDDIEGDDGLVVANDNDSYNYGRNGSFYFDGTGSWIDTDLSNVFENISIFGWFKVSDCKSGDDNKWLGIADLGQNNRFRVACISGSNDLTWQVGDSSVTEELLAGYLDEWLFIEFSYVDTVYTKMCWRNETEADYMCKNDTKDAGYTPPAGQTFQIGNYDSDSADAYDGWMDEFVWFDRILNDTERDEVYNNGLGMRFDETSFYNESLTRYYNDMDGLKDQSGTNDFPLRSSDEPQQDPEGVPGIIDQWNYTATSFDGIDDSVTSSANSGITTTDPFSMSAWVKVYSDIDAATVISMGTSGTNDMASIVTGLSSDGNWGFRTNGGNDITSSSPVSADIGTWVWMAVTYDGTTVKLYRNKIEIASTTRTLDTNDGPFFIGDSPELSRKINADIQDVNFWDVELSTGNLDTIYQSGAPTQLAIDLIPTDMIYNNSLTYNKGTVTSYDPGHMIQIGSPSSGADGTICTWFFMEDNTDTTQLFMGKDYSGLKRDWWIGFYNVCGTNDVTFYLDDESSAEFICSDDELLAEQEWHHVCALFGSAGMSMYIDGELQADTDAATYYPSTSTSPYIGCARGDSSSCLTNSEMDGKLDDIRWYDRQLNASEVLEVYTYTQLSGEAPPSCEVTYKEFGDDPQDYSLYYPFEYTTNVGTLDDLTGENGPVVGLDNDTYNYGRNGSIYGATNANGIYTTGVEGKFETSTYSFWLNSTETAADARNGIFTYGANNNGAFLINYNSIGPIMYINNDCYQYWINIPEQDDGQWHYWTVNYDTANFSNWALYVDNVEIAKHGTSSSTCSGPTYTTSLNLLHGYSFPTTPGTTGIDDFAKLNGTISSAHRTELWNGGSGKRWDKSDYYNESTTLYYNDMDGLKDQSDNGITTDAVNAPQQEPQGVPGIIGGSEGQGWNLTATSFNDDRANTLKIEDAIDFKDDGFAWAFWIKPHTSTSEFTAGDRVFQVGESQFINAYMAFGNICGQGANTLQFHYGQSTGNRLDVCGSTILDADTWYHVVFNGTGDSNDYNFYVNGVEETMTYGNVGAPIFPTGTNQELFIGTNYVMTSEFLDADLQDLNKYDRTLSLSEITALYQSGAPTQLMRDIDSTGLVYNNSLTYNKGNVMVFDGDTNYLNAGTLPTGNFSIAFWGKVNDDGSDGAFLGDSPGLNGHPDGLYVYYYNPDDAVSIIWGDNTAGQSVASANGDISMEEWYHYVVTFEPTGTGDVTLYIDGVSINSAVNSQVKTGYDFHLGDQGDDYNTRELNGALDDVRVYDYILNPTEITAIYNYGQLSFTDEGPSCITSFGTTVDPATVYTVDSMTCTALWESNFDPTAPTSVNFTQTWYNESTQYSQFNQTGAADGQIYNLIVPSAATLYNQNWSCEVNWTYNPTLSQTVNRTIQNSLPVLTGNFTYSGVHTEDIFRNFTCTDPDTTQDLTMNISFQDDFRMKNYYDLNGQTGMTGLTALEKGEDGYWYALSSAPTDTLYKLYANFTNTGENWTVKDSAGAGFDVKTLLYGSNNSWWILDSSDGSYNCVYKNSTELNCTSVDSSLAGTLWDVVRDRGLSDETNPNETMYYTVTDDGGTEKVYAHYGDRKWVEGASPAISCYQSASADVRFMHKWNDIWYFGDAAGTICKVGPVNIFSAIANTSLNISGYADLATSSGVGPAGWIDLYRDDEYYYASYDETANNFVYSFYSKLINNVSLDATGTGGTLIGELNYTAPTTDSVYDTGRHQVDITCSDGTHNDTEAFTITSTNTPPTKPTSMTPSTDGYSNINSDTVSFSCTGQTDTEGDTIITQLFRNISAGASIRYIDLFQALPTTTSFSYLSNNTALTSTTGTLNIPYYFDTWTCRACDTAPQLPDFCSDYTITLEHINAKYGECSEVPNSTNIGDGALKGTFINFTFEDENPASGISLNATASVFIDDLYSTYPSGTANSNLADAVYVNTTENPFYTFCMTPQNDYPLVVDYSIFTYASTGYVTRTYSESLTLSNTTTNKILYLLSTADGSYVTFITQTNVGTPIDGVAVTVERFDVASTSYIVIANGVTDGAGSIQFFLDSTATYRVTFVKAGFSTVQDVLQPSQSTYTITMGATELTIYDSPYEGLLWRIAPSQSFLEVDANYTFQFNISANLSNLYYCTLELVNSSGDALSSTTGCDYTLTNGLGDNLSINYTMPNYPIFGRLGVMINSTNSTIYYMDTDTAWYPISDDYSSPNSLLAFFQSFSSLNYSDESTNNAISRMWFFFLLMAILISILTYITGEELHNPLFMTVPLVFIIWAASYVGFFTIDFSPCVDCGYQGMRLWWSQWHLATISLMMTLGYIIQMMVMRQGGQRV